MIYIPDQVCTGGKTSLAALITSYDALCICWLASVVSRLQSSFMQSINMLAADKINSRVHHQQMRLDQCSAELLRCPATISSFYCRKGQICDFVNIRRNWLSIDPCVVWLTHFPSWVISLFQSFWLLLHVSHVVCTGLFYFVEFVWSSLWGHFDGVGHLSNYSNIVHVHAVSNHRLESMQTRPLQCMRTVSPQCE